MERQWHFIGPLPGALGSAAVRAMSGLAITSRKVTLEYEESDGYLRIMGAREGVEPPTPAFSELGY